MSGFIGLMCERCNSNLEYDIEQTIQAYEEDEQNMSVIPPVNVFDYLVYVCNSCGCPVRLTYQQVEEMERKALAKLRHDVRMAQAGKVFEFDRKNNRYLSKIDEIEKMEKEEREKYIEIHKREIDGI